MYSRDLDNNVTMMSIVKLSCSLSNVMKGYVLDSFVIWDSEKRGDQFS